MKKITLKIKSCEECPKFNNTVAEYGICTDNGYIVNLNEEIPDFCPLEDCEEEDEKD